MSEDQLPWLVAGPVLGLCVVACRALFRAKTAGGCTSGNGLSGTSMLSPASLVSHGDVLRHGHRRELPRRGGDLRWTRASQPPASAPCSA